MAFQDSAGECAGCGWAEYERHNPRAMHRHDPAEDGPRAECCAHTCGTPAGTRRHPSRVRHCGACDGMVWTNGRALYRTAEDAAGDPPAPCRYPGCLGTADGASCRHPRAEDGTE